MKSKKSQKIRRAVFFVIAAIIVGSYFYFSRDLANAPMKLIGGNEIAENIPVVIVPHFDLYKEKRSELLKQVAEKTRPKTVVIVSVDHFNAGTSDISTTDKEWEIASGKIAGNKKLAESLTQAKIATSNSQAFGEEHGIKNILADSKKYFSADILPVMIKDSTSKDEVDQLYSWMAENCQNCLVISSVDFSHYQPSALADVHDSYSILALQTLDLDKIWSSETDSAQSLYLAAKIAKKNGANNFNLFYNDNSGKTSKSDDAETTSVVLGYYSGKQSGVATESSTSFVIAGDVMLDRNVWHNYKDKGLKTIFDNFGTRVFRGSDVALLNLEGPISVAPIDDDWQSGSMVFNFPPETPSILKYLNVGAVSLANNHTANAGAKGLENTKKVLTDSNIKYFGKPTDYSDGSVLRIPGPIPVTLIGIMTLDDFDQAGLSAKIKSEKAAGQFVIVYPHWGEEYKEKHVSGQAALAKEWIGAGADMIVGSHPHVTEDFEMVKAIDSAQARPVVYSLGNFVFDQFFSQETQEGLVIAGTITKDKITLSFLPTVEKTIKPQFMTGSNKTNKIKAILDIDSQVGFKKISTDTIEIKR